MDTIRQALETGRWDDYSMRVRALAELDDLDLDSLAAENAEYEKALAQACTNLATIRGSNTEGRSVGDDARAWKAALLAGWGGPDWSDAEWLDSLAASEREEGGLTVEPLDLGGLADDDEIARRIEHRASVQEPEREAGE